MDWNSVLSAGLGLVGGLVSAAALLWRMASTVAELQTKLASLETRQQKTETSFDTFGKEQGIQWQNLNRTLGRIEGEMAGDRDRESRHEK